MEKERYSVHTFMFPFQWSIKGFGEKTFSEQIDLNKIQFSNSDHWERVTIPANDQELDDLYNEKNYFYEFIHEALYDNGSNTSLIRHYERNEPKRGRVLYRITCVGGKEYELDVKAINLNLYSTGVGVLSFFMENRKYADPEAVLNINQYGRRVFPPFIKDVEDRSVIAKKLEFIGLHERETGYCEEFSHYSNKIAANTPATFITEMIREVATNIQLKPVIDDRMFVLSWYKNNDWANQFSGSGYDDFIMSNNWYEFLFVDKPNDMSCQNTEMQKALIKGSTYERWQKWCSLYGVSRYSMVYLTNTTCPAFLIQYFETEYSRMAELILVQKASILRFSAEVTNISNLENSKGLSLKLGSLYKEYIRFVNQIHFREVSAQDQGIEMYEKLYKLIKINEHVEKLDKEIEELYNYVTLQEDRRVNNTVSLLTWIATIFVPITVVAGIFGMSNTALNGCGGSSRWFNIWSYQFLTMAVVALIVIGVILIFKRKIK
ncbi:CorA family divalent cation transporter [Tannerella sp.]|uniref:CorA family divalent cation transporter n=1 Tax=Tannerella sp. TaxID=2382127 RepID=UPI0026DD6E2F|nr:CorA family divalent cation transporter [Tannerella sp.]MDO4703664.1 CorA family divalent cation transporter [Tannerella sp.]